MIKLLQIVLAPGFGVPPAPELCADDVAAASGATLRSNRPLGQPRLTRGSMIVRMVLAAAASSVVAATAAGGPSPSEDVLEARLPLSAKVTVFDPSKISESHEFGIAEDLFEGLTAISAGGQVGPGVAASWETSKDGLNWTLHLRENARWSNGEPVTSDDFVYSLRRELSPSTASPSAEALSRIVGADDIRLGRTADLTTLGVRALSKHTLQISLTAPTAWLPMMLTHFAAMPVPRSEIAKFGDQWTKPGRMVGNGAYVLADVESDGTIHLERNPYFHDATSVTIPVIRYAPAPKPGEALTRFDAGEFDVVTVVAPDVPAAKARHPSWTLRQTELATKSIVVNPNKGPLQDSRMRRALSMALDREELITTVEKSTNAVAYELVAPGLSGYAQQSANWASEPLSARVAAARKLVGGLSGGPARVSLMFRDGPLSRRLAAAIADTWRAMLGIETTLEPVDGKVYLERLNQHAFELAVVSWDPDFADASNYLGGYRCDAGAANFGAYCDPAFDELMDKAGRTVDASARIQLLQAAERLLIDQDAVMPLAHGVLEFLVNPRLKGWEANPLSRHPSRYLRIESTGGGAAFRP